MNSDPDYPEYRAYKTSGRRKFIFYAYLLLFGIIIGVILTNTFGPAGKTSPGDNDVTGVPAPEKIAPYAITHPEAEDIHSDYESMVIAATRKSTAASSPKNSREP